MSLWGVKHRVKNKGNTDLVMSEYSHHPVCEVNMLSHVYHKETLYLDNFHRVISQTAN